MPNRQRQIEKAKQEMATMYKIIKNDGGEDELSQDQPLLSMIKFNIAIMLDKFKEMGEEIKKLNEEAEQISWKSIAKQKTQTLQEFFPDYNPTFQTCPDEEAIRDMLKKVFDENEKLKAENEFLKADTDTDEELPSDVEEDLWVKAMEDAVVYSYTRPTD